jgi:RHS repeat-associated protein
MKLFSLMLLVSVVFGFVLQSRAQTMTCKAAIDSYTDYCKSLPDGVYIPKTTYEVKARPGGIIFTCWIYQSNGAAPQSQVFDQDCTSSPPETATKPSIDAPACVNGSIVHTDNQVVGESVKIVGAPFNLTYFTNRVVGRLGDYRLKVPLTDQVYDSAIKQVRYTIKINGATVITKTVSASANLNADYAWSGLTTGKVNLGSGIAQVLVEQLPGGSVSPFTVPIGSVQAKNLGFGGWMPSVFHFYDIARKQVIRGDGSSFSSDAELLTGNILRVADSDRKLVYIFDSLTGRHLQTKSYLLGANILVFNYDSNGLLVGITEPFNVKTLFNRNALGELLSITAPNGKVTLITLDANKYISAITSPANQVYAATYYDAKGLLKTFKKPLGQVSTFTFDSLGNLTKDAHSGGYAFTLSKLLNGNDQLVIIKTQMSRVTSYTTTTGMVPTFDPATGQNIDIQTYFRTEYKPDGRLINSRFSDMKNEVIEKDLLYTTGYKKDDRFKNIPKKLWYTTIASGTIYKSLGRTESFVLNDPNNPFSIKTYNLTQSNQDSAKTITVFDGTTKTFVTSSPAGVKVTTKIDAYERPISIQVGSDLPKVFTYTNDKLTRIAQGSRVNDFTYNATTKLVSSTRNALGQTTSYAYDSVGRLTSTLLPDSKKIIYSYDVNDKLIGITPADKPKHNFSFNALELLSQYSPPVLANSVSATTVFTYNGDKQLLSETKPDGKKTTYNYDTVKGTIKSITAPEGTFTYNFNTLFGEYDKIKTPASFETQKRRLAGGFLNYDVLLKGTATLGYYRAIPNNKLQVVQDTVQGGANEALVYINYTYTTDGKIQKAGAETITYDKVSGRVSGTTIGSGTAVVKDFYQYNTYGELSSYVAKYNSTTLYSLNLVYDNVGRIITKQEAIKGISQTYDYAYDIRGRLNEVKKNGAIISKYNYDGNGNRISGTVSGQTITASYDSQDRLATYNTNTYQYNLNGELLSKKNTTTNVITPFTFNSSGQLTSVKVGSNTYAYQIDGFGRRIQKSVSGTLQGSYIYMDNIRLAGTVGSDGKVSQRYVYGTKVQVPDYIVIKGENYRVITDHLGSVRLVVRVATGVVVHEMLHDEYGKVLKNTAQGYQPFGFAGGLYDHNTNLVQFGARWYDPEIGRWISKDPIGFNGGDNNLYGYVVNDPINFIDPSGLVTLKDFLGHVGTGFGVGVGAGLVVGVINPTAGLATGAAVGIGVALGLTARQWLDENYPSKVSSNACSDPLATSASQ